MLDHPRLCHLMPQERVALAEFLSQLRGVFDDQITHVWLFGSKARGDFDQESDVDLLMVVRDGSDALRRPIGDIAYTLSLEHGVLLCEHIVSAWRFAQMRARQEPLYKNVMREGIDLWTAVIASPRVAEKQPSYDVGTPQDYLRHRLERSHQDLAWARGALERGEYRLALNRAYCGVFHLTSAVLASLDVVRHRHSGTESAFHQYLIKPGFIEPEYGRFYRRVRQWRENADYHFDVEFTEEKRGQVLDEAERTVARLERFLHGRGLIKKESDSG